MGNLSLIKKVQKYLTPDLLRGRWREQSNPLEGHCYVAAEALYHALPDKQNWKPICASYNDEIGKCTHWWLQNKKTGEILDPTKEQYYPDSPPYYLGRGSGFLTKFPSKRAQFILNSINK